MYEALLIAFAGVKIAYANPIKAKKSVPFITFSTRTSCPPYHSNTAIVPIPKTSLTGPARLFLIPILLDNFKILLDEFLKFVLKMFSAL